MVRFLWGVAVNLVSAAIGLLIAFWLLPGDFKLEPGGFVIAAVVVTLCQAVLAPLVAKMAQRYAPALLGGIGIISTALGLFIAQFFPGGLTITSLTGWLLGGFIVWVVTALGGWLLLAFVLKRFVKDSAT